MVNSFIMVDNKHKNEIDFKLISQIIDVDERIKRENKGEVKYLHL